MLRVHVYRLRNKWLAIGEALDDGGRILHANKVAVEYKRDIHHQVESAGSRWV